MILIGILGGTVVEKVNLMELLLKRVQLKGNLLTPRSDEYKKELTEEFASKAMPLFFQNEIRAIVGHVFPFEEIKRAHEHMEANKNFGKIITGEYMKNESCLVCEWRRLPKKTTLWANERRPKYNEYIQSQDTFLRCRT